MQSLAHPQNRARPLSSLLPPTRSVPAKLARSRVYLAGDAALLRRPCVAVVGSRKATPSGLALAEALAQKLAAAGVVVASGLALGIDAAAHRGALAAGGSTAAVLGTGLDRSYPRAHAALQAQLARDHLVVSPFAPGSPVRPGNFPRRNRWMAALTDATVVVEAGPTSGVRHQVAACLGRDLERPVFFHESLAARAWVRALLPLPGVRLFSNPRELVSLQRAGGR